METTNRIMAFVGCGFVGAAAGKVFSERGRSVVFCDPKSDVRGKLGRQGYKVCRPEHLKDVGATVFMISVPTLTIGSEIDLRCIRDAAANVGRSIRGKKDFPLIVIRSTVLPGMTEEIVRPILEEYSGMIAGKGFGLCMNPEFLREGDRAVGDFENPKLILIGEVNPKSGRLLEKEYTGSGFTRCPIRRVSLEMAEAQKYAHNLENAVAISLHNELRMVLLKRGFTDSEINEVFALTAVTAESAYNTGYGRKNLGPFAKSCLPKDTQAFLTYAETVLGMPMPVLAGSVEVNEMMKDLWNPEAGAIRFPERKNPRFALVANKEDVVV